MGGGFGGFDGGGNSGGSKGGGGRIDFAQAGGNKKDQVNQAFLSIKNQI